MKTTFVAPDIVCNGCANAIRRALGMVLGVGEVSVDITTKDVTVTYEAPCNPEAILAALDKAGFLATVA